MIYIRRNWIHILYIHAFETVVHILVIIMIIMIIMIMIILVMSIILYTFLLSSCSSHVTCFQEWHCDQCEMIFYFERNYKYHVKHCSGVNRYKCDKCRSVYHKKKNLQ